MIRITLILSILLLLTGCNKGDSPVPDIYSGAASALKNGTLWQFPIRITDNRVDKQDSLILAITHSSSDDGEIFNVLGITIVKPTFQYQIIEMQDSNCSENCPVMARYFTTLESDVSGDRYSVDSTLQSHFIQILNYDPSSQQIQGIFNVTFILSRDDGEGETPPEIIEFTNGEFTTKVKKEWFE